MLSKRMLNGLLVVCLSLSLTACASVACAPVVAPQACPKPSIDPTTQGGLSEAVSDLQEALYACDALNGVE